MNRIKKKFHSKDSPTETVTPPSKKPMDVFTASALIQHRVEAKKEKEKASAHTATAPEAVREAFDVLGIKPPDTKDSVWGVLNQEAEATFDLDEMRVVMAVTRQGPSLQELQRPHLGHDDHGQLLGVPRSVLANTRLAPSVRDDVAYLTIDTACENTVGGRGHLDYVMEILLKKHNVKALITPEEESYRFGPGEARISHQRFHIPIGIGGVAMIIKTSSLEDRHPEQNRIPWLAGQDWLRFMEAVVDVAGQKLILKAVGAQADLFIDVTGHLVVAVDDFPPDGWPQGKVKTRDHYAGALWMSGKAYTATAVRPEQCTHIYNPEDDPMNSTGATSRTPCLVPGDVWEYSLEHPLLYVRHHRTPRTTRFHPQEVVDGPDPKELQPLRVTYKDGYGEPSIDVWDDHVHEEPWTGITILVGFGCDPSVSFDSVRAPADHIGVEANIEGQCLKVHPKSLKAHVQKRFQRSMDTSVKPPDLPLNRHDQVFQPSINEFPNRSNSDSSSPQARHAHREEGEIPSATAAARGPAHEGAGGNGALGQYHQSGSRAQVPLTSPHGLHGGDLAEGDHPGSGPPTGTSAGIDTRQGPDTTSTGDGLRDGAEELPSSSRTWPQVWQRAWQVLGMHNLRQRVEGSGLSGADHRGDGHNVQGVRGHQRSPRREGHQGSNSSQGLFYKILCILLFLISNIYGSSLRDYTGSDSIDDLSQQGRQEAGRQEEGGDVFAGQRGRHECHGDPQHQLPHFQKEFRRLSSEAHDAPRVKLKPGQRKRMQSMARDALATSKLHKKIIQERFTRGRWPRKHFRFDLIEIFGGSSMITVRGVTLWRMKALQPVDIRYGIDLRQRKMRRWLLDLLKRANPRLALVEYPCTPWSILQSNVNYKDDPEALEALQNQDKPFLKLTENVFESQVSRGAHAVAENPATASSWQQPEIVRLRKKFFETTSCLCMYGLTGKRGGLMQKRVRFLATHPYFVEELQAECDHSHAHEEVAGSNTKLSQCYPPALADAICRAYWRVVELEDFGTLTFNDAENSTGIWFVDANKEEDKWRPLLAEAEEVLARKVQGSVFVAPDSELYKKICDLVPWQVMNIQLAHLPKAKRVRPGLEDCHRCSVLLLNDDTLTIETEYLKTAQAPRERFATPVRVAIFVLGYAPGDPAEPRPEPEPPKQFVAIEDSKDHYIVPYDDQALVEIPEKTLLKQSYGEHWFVGPPLNAKQKKLAPTVVKLHKNLGHPSQPDLTRALIQAGNVEPEAIELSRRMKCAVCERTRRPRIPRPTSFKVVGAFNSKLCMDFVNVPDVAGEMFQFLHILEPNGSFNVFYPSPSRDPGDVWDLFTMLWASWAGYPQVLWVDKDGAFEGDFLERIRSMGTTVDTPPAEAHWQAGEIEAYNRAFKDTARKIIDQYSLQGARDMKTMACAVAAAMNDKIRTSGCSAYQWLFGKSPVIPTDVLSPDGKFEALQAMDVDSELRKRSQIRATADEKVTAYRLNEAVRTAILRKSHPPRETYEPGALVAFWREAKYKQGRKGQKGKRIPASWYRGIIIGPHKGDGSAKQNNFWVSSNGKCVLVSKEQLRPAFGTELWPVHEHVLEELQENPPDDYLDLRAADGALPPEEEEVDQVPLFLDQPDEEYTPTVVDPADIPVPEDMEDEPVAELPPPAPSEAVDSTGTDLTTLPATSRAPGTPVGQLWSKEPDPKRLRTTPSASAPSEAAVMPSAEEMEILLTTSRVEGENSTVYEVLSEVAKDSWYYDKPRGLLVRLHRRPRRALYDPCRARDLPVQLDSLSPKRITVMRTSGQRKVRRDTWLPPNSNVPMDHYWTGTTTFKVVTQSGIFEVQLDWQNPQTMSRKDRKALEKELPWSAIPDEQKELYRQALVKEWNTWLKYEAVKVLDTACSRYVENNIDKSRILAARVCYRDKHAATPWLEIKPKARIVCRGDADPDLLELRRDAPTLTRLGLMLLLQLGASSDGWFVVCADITGAFLQGDQSLAQRKDPLFIRQPREGLPGLLPGQLLLVVRGIFGLANSPRLFWRFLRDTLVKLGFVQSTLDKALFFFYVDHLLVLAVGAHVDDLVCVGKPGIGDEILEKVRESFDFGDWHDLRNEDKLVYGGKEITRLDDGGLALSQRSFVKALSLSPIPKWRSLMKDDALTQPEITELKSGIGCLHWLTGQTRPDLAAGASLNQGGSRPTVTHLIEVNKLLKEAMKSENFKLTFVPINLAVARIVAFSDASWANAEDLRSQAGYMVYVTGPDVFSPAGDRANLVEWRSHRIRRRCRSTLAAETMALDTATDAALFTRELLAEMMIEEYRPTQSGRLDPSVFPAAMATDCRSLYDLVVKDGPLSSTQEKRLTLDIGALREAAEELDPSGEFMKEIYRWVPTFAQMADHLTKIKPAHELRDLLNQNHLALMRDEDAEQKAAGAAATTTSRGALLAMSVALAVCSRLKNIDQCRFAEHSCPTGP